MTLWNKTKHRAFVYYEDISFVTIWLRNLALKSLVNKLRLIRLYDHYTNLKCDERRTINISIKNVWFKLFLLIFALRKKVFRRIIAILKKQFIQN